MTKRSRAQTFSVLVCLLVVGAQLVGRPDTARAQSATPDSKAASSAQQMTEAAQDLLATLSPEEREGVRFSLDDDTVRTNWSNLPAMFVERNGLRLGDLSDEQRRLLHKLLRASMSSQGYQKLAGVIRLDDILHDEASAAAERGERGPPPRLIESWTAENYWFAFFGEPGTEANWAWQITGHHLGANFTVVGEQTSFTPLFLGAEPYEVMQGRYAGWRALSHEADRGFELLQTLDEDQRSRAVLGNDVPRDVLAGPGRKGALEQFEGLPASSLSETQQALLWALVEEYVANADKDAAAAQLAKIESDGLDSLYFAWMGSVDDPSERHYYRVHGPSVLIEYVVEEGIGSDAANHVHSIVRDPSNDYGEDWLGTHYQEHHPE